MLFAAPEGVTTKVRVGNIILLCLIRDCLMILLVVKDVIWRDYIPIFIEYRSRISPCSPGYRISRRISWTRPEHALPLALSDVFGEAAKVVLAGNGVLICGDKVPVVLIFRLFGVDEGIGRDARGKEVIAEFGAKCCA